MEDHMNLEEKSDATSDLACHFETNKPQIKASGKGKSINREHFGDIINPTAKKIEKVKYKNYGKV